MRRTEWKNEQTRTDLLAGPCEAGGAGTSRPTPAAANPPPVSDSARKPRPILSRLGDLLIASFAAYAQCTYPGFVLPEESDGPPSRPESEDSAQGCHASRPVTAAVAGYGGNTLRPTRHWTVTGQAQAAPVPKGRS